MINAKQSRKWLKYFALAPETTWYLALVSLPVSSAIRELRVHSIWSMCHGVGLLNLSRSTVLTPPAKLLLPAQFLAWRCMLANWLKTIQHIQNLKQQNSENSVMKYMKLMKCNESGTQKHLKTSQVSRLTRATREWFGPTPMAWIPSANKRLCHSVTWPMRRTSSSWAKNFQKKHDHVAVCSSMFSKCV